MSICIVRVQLPIEYVHCVPWQQEIFDGSARRVMANSGINVDKQPE
jgi:hypothetical protein